MGEGSGYKGCNMMNYLTEEQCWKLLVAVGPIPDVLEVVDDPEQMFEWRGTPYKFESHTRVWFDWCKEAELFLTHMKVIDPDVGKQRIPYCSAYYQYAIWCRDHAKE